MSAFGVTIKQSDIDQAFLTGPTEDLVAKTLIQLSKIKPFTDLFGHYKKDTAGNKSTDNQRWADYQRMDWSVRQLPAINVFESDTESKQSDQAFMDGSIQIQVFWPPNMRRSDLARVPSAFKGALQNFFSSKYVMDMLDEIYYVQRDCKVSGLNEYGKVLNWSPNVEGLVESELVPVTILSVKYRIDLRAWYRALEFDDRTKDDPFTRSLEDLSQIFGEYDGTINQDAEQIEIVVPQNITVSNP